MFPMTNEAFKQAAFKDEATFMDWAGKVAEVFKKKGYTPEINYKPDGFFGAKTGAEILFTWRGVRAGTCAFMYDATHASPEAWVENAIYNASMGWCTVS